MKTLKKIMSLVLVLSMVISVSVPVAFAAATDDLTVSNFTLSSSEADGTLTVALICDKEIVAFGSGSGDMSITDSQGNDASGYFTLSKITAGVLQDATVDTSTGHWGASAKDYTNGDTMSAGAWVTYEYTVADTVPSIIRTDSNRAKSFFDFCIDVCSSRKIIYYTAVTLDPCPRKGGNPSCSFGATVG